MYPYTTASMPPCDDATVLYDLQELHLDKIQYDAIMCSRSVHLVVRSLSFTFHLISSSRKEHCRPEMAGRLAYRRSNTGRSLTPVLKLRTQPRTVTDDKPPPPVYQLLPPPVITRRIGGSSGGGVSCSLYLSAYLPYLIRIGARGSSCHCQTCGQPKNSMLPIP